ncbi:hypothetical protein ACEQPO_20560 [Bacillus sp. SL00103]
MLACNRHGICISTGSACASGYHHPSPAVKALHVSDRDALQFIRLSFWIEVIKRRSISFCIHLKNCKRKKGA